MLEKFRLSKFELSLNPLETINLPTYKGSTFRGGLGSLFRRLCCSIHEQDCPACPLSTACPYAHVFEPKLSAHATELRRFADVPRPFVIEPPLAEKQMYNRGESIELDLILIGAAIKYLPYFIVTFRELGRAGIGKGRGRFELEKVSASAGMSHHSQDGDQDEATSKRPGDSSALVYSSIDEMVRNVNTEITFADAEKMAGELDSDSITLRLLTPTRLKSGGAYEDKPDFETFVRRLLARISALSLFHCGERLELDYKALFAKAAQVRLAASNLRWRDWERYSSRQDKRMKLGGVVGEMIFEGDIGEFLPFLVLGEYVHIGKQCVFGLGKYEIQ